jgi:hypothetical protein
MNKSYNFLLVGGYVFFLKSAKADVVLTLPDNLKVQELNKDRSKKFVNRYIDVNQVENQYRGELQYKPDNSEVSLINQGNIYISLYFSGGKSNWYSLLDAQKNTFSLRTQKLDSFFTFMVGYYFNHSLSLGFEYYDHSNEILLEDSTLLSDIHSSIFLSKNYLANLSLEFNYNRLIPFFTVSLGVMQNTFKSSPLDSKISFADSFYPLVQWGAGVEFYLEEFILLTLRYRVPYIFYLSSRAVQINLHNSNYTLKSKPGFGIDVGIKFIW